MKLKELMKKYNVSEYEVTKYTGNKGRAHCLGSVLKDEREITSINLNLISGFARGLGASIFDILDDFDLDGSTSQILTLTRLIERVSKHEGEYDTEVFDKGFVKSINIKDEPIEIKLKEDYELLDPDKTHAEQDVKPIYELNREFLEIPTKRFKVRNKSLLNLTPRYNAPAESYLIYSELEDGADFKVATNVYNITTDEFLFCDIYGVEWIDKDDNKSIVYYKYHDEENKLSPELINDSKKEEVSELEFFRGLYSQFQKFNIKP